MSRCLSDRDLLMVHYGEAPEAEQEHVRTCLPCAARYQRLGQDLERISEVLRGRQPAAPRMVAPRARWRRAVAAAIVAGLVLLGGAEVWMWRASTSLTRGQLDTDTRTLLAEMAAVLAPGEDAEALTMLGPTVLSEADREFPEMDLERFGGDEEQWWRP